MVLDGQPLLLCSSHAAAQFVAVDQALYQAHYASQISLSEIARQLGLSVSRISRIVSGQRVLRETSRLDEMSLGGKRQDLTPSTLRGEVKGKT